MPPATIPISMGSSPTSTNPLRPLNQPLRASFELSAGKEAEIMRQTLQILLLIAMSILILDSIRVGWLAIRPRKSRSGNAESREGSHGTH
jgi:hypothetical protein